MLETKSKLNLTPLMALAILAILMMALPILAHATR